MVGGLSYMRCGAGRGVEGSRVLTFWIRVAMLKTRGTDVACLGMRLGVLQG
jgi:hypothetical protein